MNIIFDFDGTLFRTETVDIAAVNGALKTMGRPEMSGEAVLALIGHPMDGLSRGCLNTDNKREIRRFSILMIRNEVMLIPRFAVLYPHAEILLKKLRDEGKNLAICSNGNRQYINQSINFLKIRRYFKRIWYKHRGISKEEGARRVMKAMDTRQCTVFVGDRKEDIDVAKAIGAVSIGMLHGFSGKDELDHADYTAKDITELSEILKEVEKKYE